jgi:anti-anti-sigma factor
VARQGSIEVKINSSSMAIVTLRGEHDMHSQEEVANALAVAGACTNVLVDFSHSTFVDSSVFKALLRAASTLRQHGGVLELVVPPSPHIVRRALDLMSLNDLLPSHETREAGIAHVGHPIAAPVLGRGVHLRARVEVLDEMPADKATRRRAA